MQKSLSIVVRHSYASHVAVDVETWFFREIRYSLLLGEEEQVQSTTCIRASPSIYSGTVFRVTGRAAKHTSIARLLLACTNQHKGTSSMLPEQSKERLLQSRGCMANHPTLRPYCLPAYQALRR